MNAIVITLMLLASAATAQIPPPPEEPPGVPQFRTEWVDYSLPEGAFALLIAGNDMAVSGTLILRVSGTAFGEMSEISVYRPSSSGAMIGTGRAYEVFLLGRASVTRAPSIVKIVLDVVPGEILIMDVQPWKLGTTHAELTLPSGDTARMMFAYYPGEHSGGAGFDFQKLQRAPFDPRHPGLSITRTPAGGTRERTGGGWGRSRSAKPVAVEEATWGRVKNAK